MRTQSASHKLALIEGYKQKQRDAKVCALWMILFVIVYILNVCVEVFGISSGINAVLWFLWWSNAQNI